MQHREHTMDILSNSISSNIRISKEHWYSDMVREAVRKILFDAQLPNHAVSQGKTTCKSRVLAVNWLVFVGGDTVLAVPSSRNRWSIDEPGCSQISLALPESVMLFTPSIVYSKFHEEPALPSSASRPKC